MGILRIRIHLFPDRDQISLWKWQLCTFWSTFLKGESLNGYVLFQFLLHLKQVDNKVVAVLKKHQQAFSRGQFALFIWNNNTYRNGGRSWICIWQTCCCQRGTVFGKSWSTIICVWQVHDESIITWASSWFTEDIWFPRAAWWHGPAQCGVLIEEGWQMLLSSFPTRVTLMATCIILYFYF